MHVIHVCASATSATPISCQAASRTSPGTRLGVAYLPGGGDALENFGHEVPLTGTPNIHSSGKRERISSSGALKTG
jgi:hypothetical protein